MTTEISQDQNGEAENPTDALRLQLALLAEATGAASYAHSIPLNSKRCYCVGLDALIGCSNEELPLREDVVSWLCARAHREDVDSFVDGYRAFLDGGPSQFVGEVRVRHHLGRWLWVRVHATAAARDAQGRPTGVLGTIIDQTEIRALREREALFRVEIDHRAKNLLAAVQSMASLTVSVDTTPARFVVKLVDRIQALSRAHEHLADGRWLGASLRDLLHGELAILKPMLAARVLVEGEDVVLKPRAVQTLALILHELVVNSIQFGALSVPEGQVCISWSVAGPAENPRFCLSWTEANGPDMRLPTHRGFGTLMLERAVEHELGAVGHLQFASRGLHYSLTVPLTEFAAQGQPPRVGERDGASSPDLDSGG